MQHDTCRAGVLLRKLRNAQQLTGAMLGKRVGISQSKISKIESGYYQYLDKKEIEMILKVLKPSKKQYLEVMAAIEDSWPELKSRQFRSPHWQDTLRYEQDASVVRIFAISALPSLLQTVDYRHAFLELYQISSEDRMTDTRVLLKRQDLLWETNRSYHFLLYEAALYSRPGSRSVQLMQLDRIERMMGVEHIRIGIIPFKPGLPAMTCETFALYDLDRAVMEVVNGEIESTEATCLQNHMKAFTALNRVALYGDEAREVVREAASYFS